VAGGLNAATTDLDQVSLWWDKNPKANVGLRTGAISNVTVIDYDSMEAFDEWNKRSEGKAGATFLVKTPKGIHAYHKYSSSLKQTAKVGGEQVDSRNDGGYVVAPGSVVDGKEYAAINKLGMEPIPEYVHARFAGAKKVSSDKAGSDRAGSATGSYASAEGASGSGELLEGSRNVMLTEIAGRLRGKGIPLDAIRQTLDGLNENWCEEPLPEHEIEAMMRSAEDWAEKKFEIPSHTVVPVSQLKTPTVEFLHDKERVIGISTGFSGLDKLLGGFRKGEITQLTADGGTGKNTVMHRIILNLLNRGIPVGYASRELDPAEDVMPNILAPVLNRDVWNNPISEDEFEKHTALWPLYFAHGYGVFPLEEFRVWVRKLKAEHGVSYIFADHYHYMLENEEFHTVSQTIRQIKSLVKEERVHLFLIVQPAKTPEGAKKGVNSGRGSSAIGQAVDNILTMDRVEGMKDVSRIKMVKGRAKICNLDEIYLKYDRATTDLTETELVLPTDEDSDGAQRIKPRAGGWRSEEYVLPE
jgi:KaiC/GvpD/RAD55 family RecA-like ATPase